MIRFFKKGDNVPVWFGTCEGRGEADFKFNGFVLVYKYKGDIYSKLIFGQSIVSISNAKGHTIKFKKVIMLSELSLLNIFRLVIHIIKKQF